MKRTTAGCIILYNPDTDIVSNMETFVPELASLMVIDNSPVSHRHLLDGITSSAKITYLWSGENEGIAKALNLACAAAIKEHHSCLLTMDQDSSFNKGDFSRLIASMETAIKTYPTLGILTPYHDVHEQFRETFTGEFKELSSAMTSGNLLNLDAYRQTGPFEEKMFIDYVDHEYCLRLRKSNFKIIQYNCVALNHSLGDFQIKPVFGRKMGVSNHNYLRRYYKVRNGLYTIKKYFWFDRSFCMKIVSNLFTDFLKIIFFENKKMAKIKASITGVWHFVIGRYGKYK